MFSGIYVFIIPSGLGKKRIELFEKQISLNNGVVIKNIKGQSLITHVIVDESVSCVKNKFISALKKNKLNLNKNIKYVGCKWLSKCISEKTFVDTSLYEVKYVEDGCDAVYPSKSNTKEESSSNESSPEKKAKFDVKVEKFLCAQPSTSKVKSGVNEAVIKELEKLAEAFRARKDTWRVHGYEKAISAISSFGKDITSYQEAKNIPGVGEKIALKVMEIIESGKLQKVEEICNDERTRTVELFSKIWGVGPTTSETWYQQGLRTLDDVRSKAVLTKQQVIGFKYFEELQDRMDRSEVEEIGRIVNDVAVTISPAVRTILVGSYRRGKLTCGDVDVMVVNGSVLKHSEILLGMLNELRTTGFITDDLVLIEEVGNQRKYLGVCQLPGKLHRRIDIFVVPECEEATALMHYTGSALFNRSIRILAAKKGMSLSEHALATNVIRKGMEIITEGTILSTPTEESIFHQLGLEYRPPSERDH